MKRFLTTLAAALLAAGCLTMSAFGARAEDLTLSCGTVLVRVNFENSTVSENWGRGWTRDYKASISNEYIEWEVPGDIGRLLNRYSGKLTSDNRGRRADAIVDCVKASQKY